MNFRVLDEFDNNWLSSGKLTVINNYKYKPVVEIRCLLKLEPSGFRTFLRKVRSTVKLILWKQSILQCITFATCRGLFMQYFYSQF